MNVTFASAQILGARKEQQDAYRAHRFYFADDGDNAVYTITIADGMGGHRGGREASQTAIRGFWATLEEAEQFSPGLLRQCLDDANASIGRKLQGRDDLAGMGTTLVGAIILDMAINWISVGDSLLLLLRDRLLHRLNDDHSMAPVLDQMARDGEISREDALSDPRRNSLRDALRGLPLKYVDNREPIQLQVGDRLLFATDGIETLSGARIYDALSNNLADDNAVVESLLGQVEQAGLAGQDNTTCIVASVRD